MSSFTVEGLRERERERENTQDVAGQLSVEDMSRGLMDPLNCLSRARSRGGVCRKDV